MSWKKEYKIFDHLGSIRMNIAENGSIIKEFDYEPFGGFFGPGNNTQDMTRNSFIGKEKDKESSLGDFGVRKYEDYTGRFTTPEPLWEKYYSWSPYVYSANNPMIFVDGNGKDFAFYSEKEGWGHTKLYYQNKSGDWFQYDQGARENPIESSGLFSHALGISTIAGVIIKKIDATEIKDGAIYFITNSKQDEAITESAIESQKAHNKRDGTQTLYNLYFNNCTDAAVDVINNANIGFSIYNPWFTILPGSWFEELRENIDNEKKEKLEKQKETINKILMEGVPNI